MFIRCSYRQISSELQASESVCLFALCKYYWLDLPEKNHKMDLGQTLIPLNLERNLDHWIQTKIRFFQLLIIMCLGGGKHSPSALVFPLISVQNIKYIKL